MLDKPLSDEQMKNIMKRLDACCDGWMDYYGQIGKSAHERLIEKAKKAIKHPHFQYAEVDLEKNAFAIKRKRFFQWFSGRRSVLVKVPKMKLEKIGGYKRK